MFKKLIEHEFLFKELVKRDFKTKYKGTWLGMAWSVLSPLMMFFVMNAVFTEFFGRTTPHYTVYLLIGNIIYSFFSESTKSGMTALRHNAAIITKVNVPKYLFILSKNVQTTISFLLNIVVLFIFVAVDGLPFTWKFFLLLYPTVMLLIFNIGVGFILSALYVFFNDMSYLYDVLLRLIMYMSAIFYNVDSYGEYGRYFLLNPVYGFIKYFRCIIIDGVIPSWQYHLLVFGYAALAMLVGGFLYKKYNNKFLYYL